MKIAKAKALDHVARVNERHGACRCESWLLPTNWIQSLFLSLRMDGATVICSCIGRYHTIPYSWSAAKESAGQSKMLQTLKWRCKKTFRMQFFQGMRMMQSGYAVKRYSELPKTITLTKDRIFLGFADRSSGWASLSGGSLPSCPLAALPPYLLGHCRIAWGRTSRGGCQHLSILLQWRFGLWDGRCHEPTLHLPGGYVWPTWKRTKDKRFDCDYRFQTNCAISRGSKIR